MSAFGFSLKEKNDGSTTMVSPRKKKNPNSPGAPSYSVASLSSSYGPISRGGPPSPSSCPSSPSAFKPAYPSASGSPSSPPAHFLSNSSNR